MRLVCQQPHYFPWLGYFELFRNTDAFVFLDSVQWLKQGRQHRTKIMGPNGTPQWLTVPIKSRGHRQMLLKDMEVDLTLNWTARHWNLVKAAYKNAPYFKSQIEPLLRPFFEKVKAEKYLVDISQESLFLFWDALGLSTELHWSSDLPAVSGRHERLIELCRHFGASEYYSSLGSTRYLDVSRFREHGIRVFWQHFRASFPGEPLRSLDLSILDWVAHHELSTAKKALEPLPALAHLATGLQSGALESP